jgi:hypothetical protein
MVSRPNRRTAEPPRDGIRTSLARAHCTTGPTHSGPEKGLAWLSPRGKNSSSVCMCACVCECVCACVRGYCHGGKAAARPLGTVGSVILGSVQNARVGKNIPREREDALWCMFLWLTLNHPPNRHFCTIRWIIAHNVVWAVSFYRSSIPPSHPPSCVSAHTALFRARVWSALSSLSSSFALDGALLSRFLELFLVQFGFLGLGLFFFFGGCLVGAQFLGLFGFHLLGHVAIIEYGRQ